MKHDKSLSDSDSKLTKPKRGQGKALRSMRRKAYYGARPSFTNANKKRTLGAHIRAFPEDMLAVEQFKARYGAGSVEGHLASPVSKARKRSKRRARQAKRIAEIKHQLVQPALPFTVTPPAFAPYA